MYYDQSSNELNYYNGADFIKLADQQDIAAVTAVSSIGGVSGPFTLGGGLTQAGTTITNSGVLTVQGQSGNVTLTGGSGIVIDGTTISSTGISSFGGASGDITIGPGLSLTDNQISNSGIITITSNSAGLQVNNDGAGNVTLDLVGGGSGTVQSPGGTSGRIAKFTGVQTIADSLLSEAA